MTDQEQIIKLAKILENDPSLELNILKIKKNDDFTYFHIEEIDDGYTRAIFNFIKIINIFLVI
jgi:hypothetical protein